MTSRFLRVVVKIRRFNYKSTVVKILAFLALCWIFVSFVVPLLFFFFPTFTNWMFVNPIEQLPKDYRDLSQFGFPNGHSFFLLQQDYLLNIWYIPPMYNTTKLPEIEPLAPLADPGQVIVIFLHGIYYSLGGETITYKMKAISEAGAHVIGVEYRGFGWSPGSTTGNSMVADVLVAYDYIRRRSGMNPILFYGYSFGTMIGARSAEMLHKSGYYVPGVLLESAFDNLKEIALDSSYIKYSYEPLSSLVMSDVMDQKGLHFITSRALGTLPDRTVIVELHAADDGRVSAESARQFATNIRRKGRRYVYQVMFPGCARLAHNVIQSRNLKRVELIKYWIGATVSCYDWNTGKRSAFCVKDERVEQNKTSIAVVLPPEG